MKFIDNLARLRMRPEKLRSGERPRRESVLASNRIPRPDRGKDRRLLGRGKKNA
jgi:hypothetical protein